MRAGKIVETRSLTPMAAALLGLALPAVPAAQEAEFLEELIVTSSRIATPIREIGTAVSVIDAEDIEIRGYHNMADLLRTQPGIGVTNTGGAGKTTALRIRGEEGYRTLVMIDGVEMSDPTGTQVGPAFAHLATTSEIERVEILRGSQGFIYGADAGGVVNILTRTGEGPLSGQFSAELGEFGTTQLDANLSGGSSEGDFFVSVSDMDSDGYNSRVSDIDLVDDDGYENTTFHTKLGWTPTEDLRLQLVARDIDALSEFDGCFGATATNDCAGATEQTTFKLSADYDAGRTTHFFAVANTDILRENFAAGVNSFSTRGDISRIEYTGSFELSDAATFVYGADLEREDIVTSGGDSVERDQKGYYFEYQGELADNFFVSGGARYDDNDDFGEHTSLRATLAYISDLGGGNSLKYRASYGTGFRAPSLAEIAYNIGPFAFAPAAGVQLKEESSAGFDIGLDYIAANGMVLQATYFDQEIEDEIFFDLSTFSGYLQSLGTSQSTGIELGLEYPFNSQWEFLGNLTYNDTENTEGLQRIRRPEKLANLGLRYVSPGERVSLIANYRISRDSVNEVFGLGRVPLDDYEVLDVSAVVAINDSIEAFARLENVTDEDYEEVTGFNTPGSSASAGIRLRF